MKFISDSLEIHHIFIENRNKEEHIKKHPKEGGSNTTASLFWLSNFLFIIRIKQKIRLSYIYILPLYAPGQLKQHSVLFLPCLLTEHWFDVVREVEFQWIAEVRIQNFNLIEQRIEDECHVIEHALFASLIALSSIEGVELDSQLGWGVRTEVVDLHLLRDQVAVVSAL